MRPAPPKRLHLLDPADATAHAIEAALGTLEHAGLQRADLTLGAGVTLTARWAHRTGGVPQLFRSPDIEDPLRRAITNAVVAAHRGKAHTLIHNGNIYQWETGHGAVQLLYDTMRAGREGPPLAVDAATGVPVETVETVLARKLCVRMGEAGQLLERDLADIVAAHHLAPATLSRARWRAFMESNTLLGEEIRFTNEITLDDGSARERARRRLRTAAAQILSAPVEDIPRPSPVPAWVRAADVPPAPVHPNWYATPMELEPHKAFARLRTRGPLRHEGEASTAMVHAILGKHTAGLALRPAMEETHRVLRSRANDGPTRHVRAWLSEGMTIMTGLETMALRQGCGASVEDIAWTARAAGMCSDRFIAWLNHCAARTRGTTSEALAGYAEARH